MIMMRDSQLIELESVVGVESIIGYPYHCGGGHTPLLSLAPIPENGVELACVIGLPITEGNEAILTKDVQDDDSAHTLVKAHKLNSRCLGYIVYS